MESSNDLLQGLQHLESSPEVFPRSPNERRLFVQIKENSIECVKKIHKSSF